jgi:hypothetical protein
MRSGQRLPQLTVQALQTTFHWRGWRIGGMGHRVKGNVSALLASARPPIAVVFIKPRRLTSAASKASGALIFMDTRFGCSQ